MADCPFRYQGQYEDVEIGLYYKRRRYYAPDEGICLNHDPIRLAAGERLYSYVHDTNIWVDPVGLQGNLYDIVNYGNKSPDLFKYHNIMDAWAKNNIPGYVSRQSGQPTILIVPHQLSSTVKHEYQNSVLGNKKPS